MKAIIKIGIGAMLMLQCTEINAQQDPQFTQYFDNTLSVNPAYAGSRGMLNITGIHREQWVGFDGRPRSSTLSIHSPLSYESVGVGLTLVNDQAGPMKQTMLYGDFSYTLRFQKERKLSFGVKAGFNMINNSTSGLLTTDASDPNLMTNTRNYMSPNVGFGIYYHTPKFFIGTSSPKLLQGSFDKLNASNIAQRHYFAIVGGVIPVSQTVKLRPTGQFKATANAPLSIDASLAAIINDKVWFGGMYRLNAAFGAFFQVQCTPQFKIGLASDFGVQKLRSYNNGTFELMASYDFIFKKQGVRSPRYF